MIKKKRDSACIIGIGKDAKNNLIPALTKIYSGELSLVTSNEDLTFNH